MTPTPETPETQKAPPTALERIEILEKKLQEVDARAAGAYDFAERALTGGLGVNQSLAATAKTLTALISVMEKRKSVTGEEILDAIRDIDEKNSKEEVQDAVKAGNLKALDVVHQGSVVVVKQVLIAKENPKPIVTANYRVLELQSQFSSPRLREQFAGKKVGDVITMSDQDKTILTTIIEAYEIVEMNVPGEGQQAEGAGANGENQGQTEAAGTGPTA